MSWLRHTKKRTITAASALLVLGLLPVGGAAMTANAAVTPVGDEVVYDATPSTLPPNMASLGFQATSTSEFGDYVHLAGTNRVLNTVTVTMSDWALYADYSTDPRYMANSATWTHPVTVNVYSNNLVNGVPDTLLATKTESISIPWRPVADPICGTKWLAGDGQCYSGIAFNAVFDLSSLGVALPNDVIVGIAFNTQTYGAAPIDALGPYNSLNVGVETDKTPTVGTDDNADNVFWDTTYPSYTAGFRQDTGWAPNGTVSMKITATLVALVGPPTSKDQCVKSGWMTFNNPSFKNQGDCVSFVATGGKDAANG